jgi:hypothetical protein
MFNTLRMQLGGIVCLALSTSQGEIKKVHALLADAREPGHNPAGGHHPPHVGALQFYTDQLSPNNKLEPDLRFRLPGSSREQGVVFLVREDLEIEGTKNLPPPSILHGRSNDHLPANDIEERDFFWMADFAALGVTGLQAGCIDTMVKPPASLLARFALYGGVLSTGDLVMSGGSTVQVPFLDESVDPPTVLGTYNQAIAFWADWEARVPPDSNNDVAIRLTSFDNGKQRRLVFSYAGLPAGGSLWVSIKNVTLSDLLELSDIIEPSLAPGMHGTHFDLHYGIADPTPNPQWVLDPSLATDGKPLCPPTKFMVEV